MKGQEHSVIFFMGTPDLNRLLEHWDSEINWLELFSLLLVPSTVTKLLHKYPKTLRYLAKKQIVYMKEVVECKYTKNHIAVLQLETGAYKYQKGK